MKKIVVGKFLANGEFDFENPKSQDGKSSPEKTRRRPEKKKTNEYSQPMSHRDQIISTLGTVPTVGTNVKWCAPSVDIK